MAPNSVSFTRPTGEAKLLQNDEPTKGQYFETPIVWKNVIKFFILHVAGVYAIWELFTQANWKTGIYAPMCGMITGLGITAGVHRLWSHKAYEAKLPLKILLMLLQTTCQQNDIYVWARDHRVHHKFTDVDADPHNSRRGFFFSHIGWLLMKKHKDVIMKGKTLDLSDLEADPVVRFQKKYYTFLVPICCVLLPSLIPHYCWGETWWHSLFATNIVRYLYTLHSTWSVNSVAHMFGTKPYDGTILPVENGVVSILACGEGWHNYHHAFPCDYKTAELGNYHLNLTTAFIHLMAKIGWAYNMKTTSPDQIRKFAESKGDGSWKGNDDDTVRRYGDKNMNTKDVDVDKTE